MEVIANEILALYVRIIMCIHTTISPPHINGFQANFKYTRIPSDVNNYVSTVCTISEACFACQLILSELEYPSCLHTTAASATPHRSLHTVPHTPL